MSSMSTLVNEDSHPHVAVAVTAAGVAAAVAAVVVNATIAKATTEAVVRYCTPNRAAMQS